MQATRFGKNPPALTTSETVAGAPSPVAPFELVEFLQLAGLSRRSIVIAVESEGNGTGRVEIVAGDVWNASVGSLTGTEAMSFLIEEKVPVVAIEPMCYQPEGRQITVSLTGLLLDLAKKRDDLAKKREETRVEQEQGAQSAAERFRLVCIAAQRKLPEGCGLILVDLLKRTSLAVARPQQNDWSGFSSEAAETIACLMTSLNERQLDFGSPAADLASAEKPADLQQVQQVYLATSCCQYFVTQVPERPTLAFALVTGTEVLQGEGWVSLRTSLAKIVDTVQAELASGDPSNEEVSKGENTGDHQPPAFQRSASR